MKISCISCRQKFSLVSGHINAKGSLVRCPKCDFIFIVYPPDDFDQAVVQDTNIDQSILDALFRMEHTSVTALPIDDISEEWNSLMDQGILPIEDFDEEAGEETDSDPATAECVELPDLSEYEDMIDWGENPDSENSPPAKPQHHT